MQMAAENHRGWCDPEQKEAMDLINWILLALSKEENVSNMLLRLQAVQTLSKTHLFFH